MVSVICLDNAYNITKMTITGTEGAVLMEETVKRRQHSSTVRGARAIQQQLLLREVSGWLCEQQERKKEKGRKINMRELVM
jgi:hypothetical protein